MAKTEKKNTDLQIMLKEALVLFLITLVSGLLLGFVYQLTKDPIAKQQELAIRSALADVFPGAADFELIPGASTSFGETTLSEASDKGITLGDFYLAKDSSGNTLGYVLSSTSSEGYGGNIAIYVGITVSGEGDSFNERAVLNGISILTISETAGLGMRAEEVLVPQFANKSAETFTYTKTGSTSEHEIDAITGATITTKAVLNAVNVGMSAAQDYDLANGEGGVR